MASALQNEIKNTDIHEFYLEDGDGNGDYFKKDDVQNGIDTWIEESDEGDDDVLLVYKLVKVIKTELKKTVKVIE